MINLAHCISRFTYGGAEKYAIDLLNCNISLKLPIKQYLIVLNKSDNSFRKLIHPSIEICNLNIYNLRSYHTLKEIEKFSNFLKQKNITILHTHTNFSDFIGTIAARKAVIPLTISTEHNTSRFRVSKSIRDIRDRYLDLFRLRNTNGIILISKDVRDYFFNHTRYPINKTKLIYSGINIDEFVNAKPKQLPGSQNKILYVIVGRFHKQKNHLFFIDVIKELVKHKNNVHFYFAGDGELRKKIEKKIQKYNLNEYITLLGNIDWIPTLLQSVDCFLMPSLWEGLPISAIEAMAAGLPVIGHNISGINDLIDNNTGKIIPLNNLDLWVDTILKLNRKQLQLFGSQAQKEAIKHYQIQNTAQNIYKFYIDNLKLLNSNIR